MAHPLNPKHPDAVPTTKRALDHNAIQSPARQASQWRGFITQAALHLLAAVVLSFPVNTVRAECSVTLAWDSCLVPEVAGYCVYALEENSTTPIRIDVGNTNRTVLGHLKEGLGYTFTVTSYNHEGRESAPSDAVLHLVPVSLRLLSPAPATGLRGIEFAASPGRTYELQASVDLQHWTILWQPGAVAAYGSLRFEDPESAVLGCRFYRLLVR